MKSQLKKHPKTLLKIQKECLGTAFTSGSDSESDGSSISGRRSVQIPGKKNFLLRFRCFLSHRFVWCISFPTNLFPYLTPFPTISFFPLLPFLSSLTFFFPIFFQYPPPLFSFSSYFLFSFYFPVFFTFFPFILLFSPFPSPFPSSLDTNPVTGCEQVCLTSVS